jgi:hypothetical protein
MACLWTAQTLIVKWLKVRPGLEPCRARLPLGTQEQMDYIQ